MSALPARMLALACSMCTASAALGCGGDAPAQNQRPPGMVSNNPQSAPNAPVAPAAAPDAPRTPLYPQQQQQSVSRVNAPKAAADTDEPAAPEKKARDYGAELSEQLNATVSCLTGHNGTRSALTINVSAQVMPSGSISRADASGPGLSPVELSCIQKIASGLHLNGPIDGAPRSVQGHLTLQAQATKEKPQPRAAADDVDNDRDENPHDSKIKDVNDNPPEVQQRDEPVHEAPEPREEPPHEDTHAE